jgi:hypothetical protein
MTLSDHETLLPTLQLKASFVGCINHIGQTRQFVTNSEQLV